MLNRVEKEMPSMSDVAEADDIKHVNRHRNYEECSKKHGGLNRTVGRQDAFTG